MAATVDGVKPRSSKRGWRVSLWLQVALGILLTGLALYLVLRSVDLAQVGQVVRSASPGYVSLGLLSVAINLLAKGFRWKVLLGPAGDKVSLGRCLAVLVAGQTLNAFLPVRLGDLSRAWMVGGMGAGRSYTLGTVVLEKILDLIGYGLLILVLLVWIPLPDWVNGSAVLLVILALVCGLFVFWVAFQGGLPSILNTAAAILNRVKDLRLVKRLPETWINAIALRLQAGLASLGAFQNRRDLLYLASLTTLVWTTAILNNHLVLLAVGLRLPLIASLLVAIALQAGLALPAVAGRIGIFEYICVLSLAVFGVPDTLALGFGLLLHLVIALLPTLAGFASLWYLGLRRADWGV